MIRTTQQAEAERVIKSKTKWEVFSSYSLVEAVRKARDLGWEEKRVQVRTENALGGEVLFVVEPFEKECNCPNILRYGDYFD